MIPRHVAWESSLRTKVDGDVAIGHPDTVVIASSTTVAVVVGLSPEESTTGTCIVELELDVVVAIRGNGTSSCFETGLEVQVVTGGSVGAWHTRAPAREEKQG